MQGQKQPRTFDFSRAAVLLQRVGEDNVRPGFGGDAVRNVLGFRLDLLLSQTILQLSEQDTLFLTQEFEDWPRKMEGTKMLVNPKQHFVICHVNSAEESYSTLETHNLNKNVPWSFSRSYPLNGVNPKASKQSAVGYVGAVHALSYLYVAGDVLGATEQTYCQSRLSVPLFANQQEFNACITALQDYCLCHFNMYQLHRAKEDSREGRRFPNFLPKILIQGAPQTAPTIIVSESRANENDNYNTSSNLKVVNADKKRKYEQDVSKTVPSNLSKSRAYGNGNYTMSSNQKFVQADKKKKHDLKGSNRDNRGVTKWDMRIYESTNKASPAKSYSEIRMPPPPPPFPPVLPQPTETKVPVAPVPMVVVDTKRDEKEKKVPEAAAPALQVNALRSALLPIARTLASEVKLWLAECKDACDFVEQLEQMKSTKSKCEYEEHAIAGALKRFTEYNTKTVPLINTAYERARLQNPARPPPALPVVRVQYTSVSQLQNSAEEWKSYYDTNLKETHAADVYAFINSFVKEQVGSDVELLSAVAETFASAAAASALVQQQEQPVQMSPEPSAK